MTAVHAGNDGGPHEAVQLDRDHAMRLLGSVSVGRIVFTENALPAIRPVNHLVDHGLVVIRTRLTSKVVTSLRAVADPVVAYQADEFDSAQRLGWSVVVTGMARTVTQPDRVAEYQQRLQPWVNEVMDSVITIEPSIVTGIRLVPRP